MSCSHIHAYADTLRFGVTLHRPYFYDCEYRDSAFLLPLIGLTTIHIERRGHGNQVFRRTLVSCQLTFA